MKEWLILILVLVLLAGCAGNTAQDSGKAESPVKGRIHISVDESFAPVIAEQLKVFSASYPEATIIAEYKSEAECLRDLQHDSTRMIIISRGLTRDEENFYIKKLTFKPRFGALAHDAVAVIVNKSNPDSVYTISELATLLKGQSEKQLKVAVDGSSATSTVRYLIDTILKGQPLAPIVTGAKNSEDLVNYISTTPNAIGFIGISWLSNPQSIQQETALAKVKTALIECKNCDKDVFARPSQQTIMFKQYALVRELHYVLKENAAGLGSGFVNFLTLERGQLIFNRAELVPMQIKFDRRKTNL